MEILEKLKKDRDELQDSLGKLRAQQQNMERQARQAAGALQYIVGLIEKSEKADGPGGSQDDG